ncbi:MAG: hypothetical protein LBD48_05260 [Treponema sp.]|jgi:hypothetical protein|nr:hypothetical protein [Treponema sp.]
MKRWFFILLLAPAVLWAEPLYSPTWGFHIDLPEGYELAGGNGQDSYSFQGPNEAAFDLKVYSGRDLDIDDLTQDINRRLGNQGEVSFFSYGNRAAALMELRFGDSSGWGICVELGRGTEVPAPLLLALSYAPAGKKNMDLFHMSALDSIAPSDAERRYPGPIMEFGFPRGKEQSTAIAMTDVSALIREHDAEAAQTLVDREFALLRQYQFSEYWQEAWIRFYRAVYRDSWERIRNAAFQLERSWYTGANVLMDTAAAERAFAEKALAWVQGFTYERDLMGSDFVNLVSAVTEGRGDCDSRAMLWAIILAQADIPAAIMVSREYSHAMGLAGITGAGARFEAEGRKWLVAETTAKVGIGLIGKEVSDIEAWLGVVFE